VRHQPVCDVAAPGYVQGMAQRDYEEQPEAPDLGGAALETPDAMDGVDIGVDGAPESGGAGAGVDVRQDAGPEAFR
jgi:hypothetical protein